MTLLRLWVVLTLTYVVAALSIRLLILGGFILDRHVLATLIAVPAAQAAVLAAFRYGRGRPS